jgi:hypothetical protein
VRSFVTVYIYTSLLLLTFWFSRVVSAASYYGRFSLGDFVARERFKDESSGSSSNDFASVVGRLYLINRGTLFEDDEFVIDMRDRYSLYDRLNKEQLSLESRNIFQLTKFSFKQTLPLGSWTLGRTSVIDAGGVYVDGLVLEAPLGLNWNTGVFAGLNPKRSDQVYVEGNRDATIEGIFLTYQPKFLAWGKNLLISHGMVSERVRREEDRRFLTQTINYQWSAQGQVIETLYLDFVPRTNIQTGSLTWLQQWGRVMGTRANLLGVDVVEYIRRQGVRERLAPSPYNEGELIVVTKPGGGIDFEVGGMGGVRRIDNLHKTEQFLKVKSAREALARQLLELKVGNRNNFTSKDQYLQGSWTYYNDHWELVFDFEKSKEVYNDGVILNGSSVAADAIYLSSKSFFISGSLQYAADERVQIISTFFRLNYRFGSTDLPPLRDGAPPASRL